MTSVEWLEEKMKLSLGNEFQYLVGFFTLAKEMHKQEVINTWYNGYINQSPMIDEENCGEQFYNETFKKD
jgi:hypothetical protein